MFTKPKRASTVIILRDSVHCQNDESNNGFEVLMVLRHPESSFVPLAYVFPGGSMDRDDRSLEIEERSSGVSREKAIKIIPELERSRSPLASWVTGIRETFEETGILFAYDAHNELKKINENNLPKINQYRGMVYHKQISFADFLKEEGLRLAADRLFYFSHWVTPMMSPIRFDTRFFIAKVPEYQPVQHDGHELIEHVWITPLDALRRYEQKNFRLVFPTLMTLKMLSSYRTADQAIGAAKNENPPSPEYKRRGKL